MRRGTGGGFLLTGDGAVIRPDWDSYWLVQANVARSRATCLRKQVGAVAVYRNKPVSQGYNGAPEGAPHCLDAGCLMHEGHCIRCFHAELNALRHAHGRPIDTLYCTLEPCWRCVQFAVGYGVTRIVFEEPYPCPARAALLAAYGQEELMVQHDVPQIVRASLIEGRLR